MRRTVLKHYPGVHVVIFLNGKVKSAELTFSNVEDAEKVANIWSTSTPRTSYNENNPTLTLPKLF